MSMNNPAWMLRAELRRDAQWQQGEPSITRYLWPSGRCYRVSGQGITDVSEAYLSCCVSMHANRSDAASCDSIPGSAFFVEFSEGGVDSPELYLVTAASLLRGPKSLGNTPTMRVVHKNGKSQLISTRLTQWQIDDEVGLAFVKLNTRPLDFSYVPVPTDAFLTPEFVRQPELGLGSTVFLPERALGRNDPRSRTASLIFGDISRMPQEQRVSSREREGADQTLSIQFRSTCGRLGSPVFLCEPPYDLHFGSLYNRAWKFGPQLLGVYIGLAPIPEHARAKSIEQLMDNEGENRQLGSECLVVPIWRLAAVLEGRRVDARSRHRHVFS